MTNSCNKNAQNVHARRKMINNNKFTLTLLICKWAAIDRCKGFSYHLLLSINCNAAKKKNVKTSLGQQTMYSKTILKICTNRNCTMHVK